MIILHFPFLFIVGSQMAESEEERILERIPTTFDPALVHPFSLPAYKSPDTKDDLVRYIYCYDPIAPMYNDIVPFSQYLVYHLTLWMIWYILRPF